MSRTRKGSKSPGWEPWSNRHEIAEQKADYLEDCPDDPFDDVCSGCPECLCVKCGGHIVTSAATDFKIFACLTCGEKP